MKWEGGAVGRASGVSQWAHMSTESPLLTRRSARGIRILFGLIIFVVGLAVASALLAGRDTVASIETYDNISRIDLDLANGTVRISGGGDRVVVDQQFTSGWMGATVNHEVQGDTLRLVMRCPMLVAIRCEGRFELEVPDATELAGRTSNGTIEIEEVEGPIDVGTSNGAIELTRLSGSVRASTSNGAITTVDMESRDVDLRTSNGRIEIDSILTPGRIVARSSNGAITIVLPSDSPALAVDASSSNGSVSIDIRTDPASGETIEARTSNGNITIRYR